PAVCFLPLQQRYAGPRQWCSVEPACRPGQALFPESHFPKLRRWPQAERRHHAIVRYRNGIYVGERGEYPNAAREKPLAIGIQRKRFWSQLAGKSLDTSASLRVP